MGFLLSRQQGHLVQIGQVRGHATRHSQLLRRQIAFRRQQNLTILILRVQAGELLVADVVQRQLHDPCGPHLLDDPIDAAARLEEPLGQGIGRLSAAILLEDLPLRLDLQGLVKVREDRQLRAIQVESL